MMLTYTCTIIMVSTHSYSQTIHVQIINCDRAQSSHPLDGGTRSIYKMKRSHNAKKHHAFVLIF